ncbi:PEP-CTERM sorting domain-containing protein [Thalassotalea hakodatensis]|uniref:PEP-CTERM sorting domain-containing protein n=1 Tax=Thalassotalea hakodatensis TaxID=3030492 RepID=UPI002572D941|nr:PEP-CTERM sorting domain-containing protein [Thalassotalea hakodatensis]
MNVLKIVGASLLIALFSSSSAVAGLTTVATFIDAKNDCKGFFDNTSSIGISNTSGNGFGNCQIYSQDENGVKHNMAWVLAKFDGESRDFEEGNKFKSDTRRANWNFQNRPRKRKPGNGSSGTWNFDNDKVDIFYWLAKAGTGFNLFWTVDDSTINSGICTPFNGTNASVFSTNLNLDCMSAAVAVNEGVYLTPSEKGLSHLTFFGNTSTVPVVVQVSEPGILLIFSLGITGLFFARRQRK